MARVFQWKRRGNLCLDKLFDVESDNESEKVIFPATVTVKLKYRRKIVSVSKGEQG